MGIVRQANGFSTDAFSSLLLSLVSSTSRAPSPLAHRTRGPKSKKHASSHLHRGESARDLLPGSVVLALHSSSDAAPSSSTARRRRWRPPKVVHLELVQRRHGAGHELRRRLGLVLVQHAVEEGHLVSQRDERGNAKKMKRVKKKFCKKKRGQNSHLNGAVALSPRAPPSRAPPLRRLQSPEKLPRAVDRRDPSGLPLQ